MRSDRKLFLKLVKYTGLTTSRMARKYISAFTREQKHAIALLFAVVGPLLWYPLTVNSEKYINLHNSNMVPCVMIVLIHFRCYS